jgi:hypothetical protein
VWRAHITAPSFTRQITNPSGYAHCRNTMREASVSHKWSFARRISVAAGVLLILPIAYVGQQEMFVLRRADIISGLKPLAEIPLENMQTLSSVSREIVIPSNGSWARMTRFYGQPKILITAINVPLGAAGHGRRTYTDEEVGIRVRVVRAGTEVPLERTNHAPYGHSSEAPSSGWLFQAAAGEHATLVVDAPARTRLPPGEVVAVADWPTGAIASDLDGFAVMDVLQWILAAIAAVGVALIVFAGRQSRRQRPGDGPAP